MTHEDEGRLSWSVRCDARAEQRQRLIQDTQSACAQLLTQHLPASAGYEIRRVRLRGAMEGVSYRISRGAFTATLSVQHYQDAIRREQPLELRVVAQANPVGGETLPAVRPRRTGLGLSAGAAMTMAVGVLAMAVTGGLTAWATAVLLIPAMFATRLCMTLWIADNMQRQRALPPADLPAHTLDAAQVRDRRRWSSLQTDLEALHELTMHRFVVQPFRGLSGGARLALAPAPLRSTG
ncbi:MAG: hypothetical protein AAGA54_09695 [Myxococcota bacterium]